MTDRTLHKLTHAHIKAAVKAGKASKLFDGGGLYLHISSSTATWRLKYRLAGKDKTLSIGRYPQVSLKDARQARDEAKSLLSKNLDPAAVQQTDSTDIDPAITVEGIGEEWWEHVHCKKVSSLRYANRNRNRLVQHVYPFIGNMPIHEVTAPTILSVLRRIESKGLTETPHRVKNLISQVFRYAIATSRASSDPTRDLKGALAPIEANHMAAVTEEEDVREIVHAFDLYQGSLVVRTALKLALLFFVRPGELRHAKWEEINFKSAEWRFKLSKGKREHIVPLARQSLELLSNLHPITGHGEYVFPSARAPRADRPMSENAVLMAIRSLGIPKEVMTGHGVRATARTLLDEKLKYPPHLIEHQLGHVVRDPLGRAYNRTKHLDERRLMMQAWADYLDELKQSSEETGRLFTGLAV